MLCIEAWKHAQQSIKTKRTIQEGGSKALHAKGVQIHLKTLSQCCWSWLSDLQPGYKNTWRRSEGSIRRLAACKR